MREPPARALLATVVHLSNVIHGVRMQVAGTIGFTPTIIAYPCYGSTTWVRVLARVVLTSEPPAASEKVRGRRALTSLPIAQASSRRKSAARPPGSSRRRWPVDEVVQISLAPDRHTVLLRSPGTAPAETQVLIVAPDATFGIVSDIDDTVMVTAQPRPLLAFWNTVVLSERARTPTSGMAVLLNQIVARHPESPVLYLSIGPWNVAPALARFLARDLYPKGILLLTDGRPTRQRWSHSGREHRRTNLERLAREFPGIQ